MIMIVIVTIMITMIIIIVIIINNDEIWWCDGDYSCIVIRLWLRSFFLSTIMVMIVRVLFIVNPIIIQYYYYNHSYCHVIIVCYYFFLILVSRNITTVISVVSTSIGSTSICISHSGSISLTRRLPAKAIFDYQIRWQAHPELGCSSDTNKKSRRIVLQRFRSIPW